MTHIEAQLGEQMEFSVSKIDTLSHRQVAMLKVTSRHLKDFSFGKRFTNLLVNTHPEFLEWYSQDYFESTARYMGLLDLVAGNLEKAEGNSYKIGAAMEASLQSLGLTLNKFGVGQDHYKMVFNIFIEAMRQEPVGAWDSEVENSWRHLFLHIVFCLNVVTKHQEL